jgi:hypothetical protein
METFEFVEIVPIEHQGDALDWVCKKYEREDLLSIMWIKTDEGGSHYFKVILRSKNGRDEKKESNSE